MLLSDFMSVVSDESCCMTVYDKNGYYSFAEYNGRDSIPAVYNKLAIECIYPETVGRISWFNVYLDMPYGDIVDYVLACGDDDAKASISGLIY